jgi:transposase
VNANEVFKWRRMFERGQLSEAVTKSTALLPVTISSDMKVPDETIDAQACSAGAIHIEFPGRAMISIESGADPALLCCVLESLRK